ncbi:MAG TPA: pyridoxamine 5'-phosphate oxidase family protein [Polaromonas sp.]|uniref:pyridoxamine 5'-phosphate oxidase family protein n=1 Tax=Polaromonas sp. TaxID=1869339 RepID=UPI002D5BABC9|nr:pyridoxamine 5'-phosphate oxidase family protein [Polaromonas sp.]HYW55334.1 pyridoxamine 5'-phosphate oxidase family protein [Polaromonas sp.]
MSNTIWHEGERAVQERVGARERLEQLGQRVIREAMPDQHREFFAQLPFVIAGSVDDAGQPWASVLAAPPGFMQSPDPQQLVLRVQSLADDPLKQNLADGMAIGLLGIEPHTRRRNRLNGVVHGLNEAGFSVRVTQSFGNCPKYIQAREPMYVGDAPEGAAVTEGSQLDAAARRLITLADTLFIATAYAGITGEAGRAGGVDVSHRGGKPGFVRVDADDTLTMPDFFGNFFFNTLGNIAVSPRAGLLFVDFDNGDLLYLAVHAEIIWDGAELESFPGALRLLRFKVMAMKRVTGSLPLRWGPAELSPALQATGTWA